LIELFMSGIRQCRAMGCAKCPVSETEPPPKPLPFVGPRIRPKVIDDRVIASIERRLDAGVELSTIAEGMGMTRHELSIALRDAIRAQIPRAGGN
jgi:hypothetical protein